MPKIPRTEASIPIRMADQPPMNPDALTGPGKALQGLGRAIAGLGGAFDAMSEPSEAEQHAFRMAQIEATNEGNLTLQQGWANADANADPNDTNNSIMSSIGGILDKYGSQITNPKLKMRWQEFSAGRRGHWNTTSTGRATDIRIDNNVRKTTDGVVGMIGTLDPNDPNIDTILNGINKHLDQTPGASVAQRERMRDAAAKALADRIEQVIKSDPQSVGPGVDRAREMIKNWQEQIKTQPQPGKVGPQSSIQDFTQGRNFAALPQSVQSDVADKLQTGGSAYDIALSFVGKNEHDNADTLSAFFKKTSGQKLNPADTAWCAAFVNATLAANGQKGTDSLLARDFLNVGTPVKTPSRGDIVVLSRGNSSWQGHVGFYAGKDGDGNIRVLGGNQGDAVNIRTYDAGRVLGFRRPPSSGGQIPGSATGSSVAQNQGQSVNLTAYSPKAGGDAMEGGYASSRKGPDGQAVVRTLSDEASGRSKYVTLAGNPRDYDKRFIIPRITFVDANGQRHTRTNVLGIVHDTGSAFANAPEGRFDIPIDRDATTKQMHASAAMWKKDGVQFIPQDAAPPVSERGIAQYAGSQPNRVADASGSIGAPSGGEISNRIAGRIGGAQNQPNPEPNQGQRAENTIPGSDFATRQREQQDKTAPVQFPNAKAAGSITYHGAPTVKSKMIEELQKRMPVWENMLRQQVDGMVKRAADVAGDGYLLPDAERQQIGDYLKRYGTEEQINKFLMAERAAAYTTQRRALPPNVLARDIAGLQQERLQNGSTPDLNARIEAMEKLHAKMTKELADDPVKWAKDNRIDGVSQSPALTAGILHPDNLEQGVALLQQRLADSQATQGRYGPEYKRMFGPEEKKWMQEAMDRGGVSLMTLSGLFYQAFGDDNTIRAIDEISPKHPEAAQVGYLMVTGGDRDAARDIATTIERRKDPNYRGKPFLPNTSESILRSKMGDFYDDPRRKAAKDRVLNATDAIYEARLSGDDKTFVQKDYEKAFELASGARDVDGTMFGGLRSWNGKSILVPSWIKRDEFEETMKYIDAGVLEKSGHPMPVDPRTGEALRMSQVRGGTWVNVGPGKYRIMTTENNRTGMVAQRTAPSGVVGFSGTAAPLVGKSAPQAYEPFTLDLNILRPYLRSKFGTAVQ